MLESGAGTHVDDKYPSDQFRRIPRKSIIPENSQKVVSFKSDIPRKKMQWEGSTYPLASDSILVSDREKNPRTMYNDVTCLPRPFHSLCCTQWSSHSDTHLRPLTIPQHPLHSSNPKPSAPPKLPTLFNLRHALNPYKARSY